MQLPKVDFIFLFYTSKNMINEKKTPYFFLYFYWINTQHYCNFW